MTGSSTSNSRSAASSAVVADGIREKIRHGILKPGDRLPSYSVMMAEHGMSSVTAERVYNGLEKEGLIVRRHGRGTFVAEPARRELTGLVGISYVSPAKNEPEAPTYWSELWQGVREVAEAHNVQLVALNQASTAGFDKVDGLLVCNPQPEEVNPLFARVLDGTPIVSALIPQPEITSVVADDYGGARRLTEHLLSLGHRRIAILTSSIHDPFSRARLRGYRDALQEAGVKADSRWARVLRGKGTTYSGLTREMVSSWLEDNWNELGCTALMAHNDSSAMGALDAFREAGISVPGQVSVTGFDGLDFGAYLTPRLTTAVVPLRQIGSHAMELLLQKINGREVSEETIRMSVPLQVRESTASPYCG